MQRISVTLISAALLGAACAEQSAAPVPDDLEMIYWSGDAQVSACYRELPDPVRVRILDVSEAPVAGESVEFRVVQGDGWVRQGRATSDSAGFAADYWTLGAPGRHILEARMMGVAGAGEFARFTATAEFAEVGERRISTDTAFDDQPAVDGDRIVWTGRDAEVYLYDMTTGTEHQITAGASASAVAISGDYIV
jgi:beta propeller repeat protein